MSNLSVPMLATEVDRKMQAHFLGLSWLAYLDRDRAIEVGHEFGYERVEFIEGAKNDILSLSRIQAVLDGDRAIIASSAAIWLEDAEKVVLSFRGTELNRDANIDIATDILAKHEEFLAPSRTRDAPWDLPLFRNPYSEGIRHGSVHLGFYGGLVVLWDQIAARIKAMPHPKPLYLTGHSLGGAIATIAFSRFMLEQTLEGPTHFSLKGLVTFGSPRVGNGDFFEQFEARREQLQDAGQRVFVSRVVNNQDPVTVLPTALADFWHVGELTYFDGDVPFEGWFADFKAPHLGGRVLFREQTRAFEYHQSADYSRRMFRALGNDISACLANPPR